MLKRIVAAFLILVGIAQFADARVFRGTPPPPSFTFNGSKLQTNLNFVGAGSYEFLDVSKLSSGWGFANNANYPVTPDILDADGWLISSAGNAASGIYRRAFVPTQDEKPGPYIFKWIGDGVVTSHVSDGAAVAYTISSATQAGTVVTVNLSSAPTAMRAGQPMTISGFTSNWNGLNNTWRVQDVNTSCSNCFRVDTGVAYTGAATFGSPAATFTTSTTVANVGGNLNGSGRYAFQPNAAIGANNGQYSLYSRISSIQSSINYPRNIQIVNLNDEAALDAGGIFSSKFLQTTSKYGVIRFLNWQNGNNSNLTSWRTRKPTTHHTWGGTQLRSDIYAGATGQTGRTYTTSAPSINNVTGAAWSGLADKVAVTALISQGAATFVASFTNGSPDITITGHDYAVGERVNFTKVGGATLPSNISEGFYYTISSVAANTIQIGVTPNANSTGTINSILAFKTYNATFTGTNSNISIPNHRYVVGDLITFWTFSGATLPAAFTYSTYYYVCSVVAGVSVQLAPTSTCAGTIITPATSSSGTIGSSVRLYLNVGGTGAKVLKGIAGQAFFLGNAWPDALSYMSLATFTYDATLDEWWMSGGNIDFGPQGMMNGVPYEIELELCRQSGAHPWWVMTAWNSDPMTDAVPSLMQLVKTSGLIEQGMVPRHEPPNELWNTAPGFIQTGYATAKAAAYGWANSYNDWYGKVLSSLGQAGAQIYGIGNLGTKYHILGGVQTGFANTGDRANSFPRFAANSYVAGGSPQAPLTGSWGTITFAAVPPAINGTTGGSTTYVSHLANAQYYTSNAYFAGSGPQTITTLNTAWNGTRFTATFSGTTMTVASVDSGAALAVGRTILCRGVPSGTTITGGSAPNWTISNSVTIAYSQGCVAGADTTAPTKLVDSVVDTVVNATITGCPGACVFTVNSITSGNTVGSGLAIYGGTVAFGSGRELTGGTYPNFNVSGNPGNQGPTSFSVGKTFSLTGAGQIYQSWASWINTNFGITKVSGYEGNYSNDYVGTYDLLTYASKQEPNLQTYATTNWNNFRGTTGAVGEFPSVYNMTSSMVIGDAWSVLDDIYQTPPSPQMNAVNAY